VAETAAAPAVSATAGSASALWRVSAVGRKLAQEWLEERGPQGCFMHLVDAATTKGLGRFSEPETTWAAAGVLRCWIERYGVPWARYPDWKNVDVRPPNAQERLRGEAAGTQFGRRCAPLDRRILAARSPQAKGRVERAQGTQQDRLVKKLRLAGIVHYDQAHADRDEHYRDEHNRRYARPAAEAADYHRRRPRARQLDEVFWLEEERVVSEDWVVHYQNRLLQLERQTQHWAPGQDSGAGAGKRSRRSCAALSRSASQVPRADGGFSRAPIPQTTPPRSSNSGSSLETRLSAKKHAHLFRGGMAPQPGDISMWTNRGHFYCGMTPGTSQAVACATSSELSLRQSLWGVSFLLQAGLVVVHFRGGAV